MSDLSKVNWKGPQPASKELATILKANFPEITRTGIYNDRSIAGTKKKSAHAEGRAIDIHLNAFLPGQKMIGDQLYSALIRKALALGIDNVIWNRQIWSQKHGGPRRYNGHSPHTDHIHVEFTRDGSQNLHSIRQIEIDIAIIRTGIEDLQRGKENII